MEDPQSWDYIEYHSELKSNRARIFITCTHFRYRTTDQCVTILTCPFHQKLIPQGEHLVKGCKFWRENRTVFAPKLINKNHC